MRMTITLNCLVETFFFLSHSIKRFKKKKKDWTWLVPALLPPAKEEQQLEISASTRSILAA